MDSNTPLAVEKSISKVTFGFMGNHDLINLEEREGPAATIDNDPLA